MSAAAAAAAAEIVGHVSCVVCARFAAANISLPAVLAIHMQAAVASHLVPHAPLTLSAARARAQEACVSEMQWHRCRRCAVLLDRGPLFIDLRRCHALSHTRTAL